MQNEQPESNDGLKAEGGTPEVEEDFSALLESFEQSTASFQQGDKVSGTLLSVGREFAFVDLGGKSEGVIPVDELMDDEGNPTHQAGDSLTATVVEVDSAEGGIRLARTLRAGGSDVLLQKAMETGVPVQGTVMSTNKGGFEVRVSGKTAFCPISQIEADFTENPEAHVGQTYNFLISELGGRGRQMVVSRAALIRQQREEAQEALRGTLQEGQILDGLVTRVKEFGAFVDIGGVEGMVHVSEMSWGRVENPEDEAKVGDHVRVKILQLDWARGRIALSMKQALDDPWDSAAEQIVVGERRQGVVVRLADFGAFVELAKGVDGLLHISDMSWTRRIRRPADVLSVGDEVEVQVLDLDTDRRRISLGMKQLTGDPWEGISERIPVGKKLTGKVQKVASFGVFVEVEEGVVGLIPASETATDRGANLNRIFQVGAEVEAKVLTVDEENRRMSLSRSALDDAAGRDNLPKPARESGGARKEAPKETFGTFGDLFADKLKNLDLKK